MNELTLIQQAKAGVASCFSQLVDLYQERLYHYLLARCHNSYDAEDVLQETFINAYKYIKSYQANWKFSTWLFTIANRLIKKQHCLYYNHDELSDSLIDDENAILLERNNIWIQIKILLQPNAYDVLWFFYIEELNMKEIANIVNKSQSWVKISLYRSKKKLAKNTIMKNLSKDYLV